MNFPTQLSKVQDRISQIDPALYGKTRNFKDGAITNLSPYISRGVISTKQIFNHLLEMDLPFSSIERLVQELAWRDYWQQVWVAKGEAIDQDLKQPQELVENYQIPDALLFGTTGIKAVDEGIEELRSTGYMHNHVRMYVASIGCNIARSHWKPLAKWMYFHLLDGDWASNALSWQWVAGSNASKKYFANQENINKYFHSSQSGTFLDVPYSDFPLGKIPTELKSLSTIQWKTALPVAEAVRINPKLPTVLYNYYNLDPSWLQDHEANRILILEPSFFQKYPISPECMSFFLSLAANIKGIQVYVGEFSALAHYLNIDTIHFKEHPTAEHYLGVKHDRDWMFNVQGYFPSFFAFWKQCKNEIKTR